MIMENCHCRIVVKRQSSSTEAYLVTREKFINATNNADCLIRGKKYRGFKCFVVAKLKLVRKESTEVLISESEVFTLVYFDL